MTKGSSYARYKVNSLWTRRRVLEFIFLFCLREVRNRNARTRPIPSTHHPPPWWACFYVVHVGAAINCTRARG